MGKVKRKNRDNTSKLMNSGAQTLANGVCDHPPGSIQQLFLFQLPTFSTNGGPHVPGFRKRTSLSRPLIRVICSGPVQLEFTTDPGFPVCKSSAPGQVCDAR